MGSKPSLNSIDEGLVPIVPKQGEIIDCRVTKVIDGDTCSILFLLGKIPMKLSLRISGIDSPEKHADTQEEILAAKISHKILEHLINNTKKCTVVLLKWDKYGGRVIGDLYCDKKNVTEILLEKGCVRKYDGGKKERWSKHQLLKILELDTI